MRRRSGGHGASRILALAALVGLWVLGAPPAAAQTSSPPGPVTAPSLADELAVYSWNYVALLAAVSSTPPPERSAWTACFDPYDRREPHLSGSVCGSTLSGAAQRFEWSEAKPGYRLQVGSTKGKGDLFDSGRLDGSVTGVDVSDLPVDGRTLHLRLRWISTCDTWLNNDCTATAASLPRPTLVGPVCGSVLPGSAASFAWASNGWPVDAWRLQIGAAPGTATYFDSGVLPATSLGADVVTLPGDGSPVHVRLRYRTRTGGWQRADCSFVAATLDRPALVLPVCGSSLDGPDATFSWSDNGWAVTAWRVAVGSTPGAGDYFSSPRLDAGAREIAATGLPSDGETLHVRLRYLPYGFTRWQSQDCTLDARSLPKPQLTGPACGGSLTGTSTAFAWDDAGRAATAWRLSLGSRVGGAEYFDSGALPAGARSVVASGLPRDGRAVQARLRWREGGVWKRVDCPYAAFRGRTLETRGEHVGEYRSTCSGSGPVYDAFWPCAEQCDTYGSVLIKIEERGSATPPAPPTPDLTGIWRGGGEHTVCGWSDRLAIPRFPVKQSGNRLSGRFATDAGTAAFSYPGCSLTCSAPGSCQLRCDVEGERFECSVSCSPATANCRTELDLGGEIAPTGALGLTASRRQTFSLSCGRYGSIQFREEEQLRLDAPAAVPAP